MKSNQIYFIYFIEMEKLLRDLNIYAHIFMECNLTFIHDGDRIRVQGDEIGPYVAESIILNKKFGFIEWLVENEKIDFSWEGKLSSELVNLFERKLDNAEGVIALLSIQDEPIKFLISILK